MTKFMATQPIYVSSKYGKIYFDRVSDDWVSVRQVKPDGTTGYIYLADEDMEKLAKGLFARHKQLHPEAYQKAEDIQAIHHARKHPYAGT